MTADTVLVYILPQCVTTKVCRTIYNTVGLIQAALEDIRICDLLNLHGQAKFID